MMAYSGVALVEGNEPPPTMGASFVQEVAEVEQGVSRCQELQESLEKRTYMQSLVLFQTLKV